MDPMHRKVEVQSLADLTYLRNIVSRSAREKIDRSFPPSAAPRDGHDDVRKRVEELVQEYIHATFTAAKSSISVNGMDVADITATEAPGEFEPFDTRLASRCTALASETDALTASLAHIRRTAPAQAAAAFREEFLADSAAFDEVLKREEEEILGRTAEEEGRMEVGWDEEKWADVEKQWSKGVKGLVGLKGALPETRARLERVKQVVEYVEGG